MNRHEGSPDAIDQELVIAAVGGRLEVRRAVAPNEGDPFVSIHFSDNPSANPPYTRVIAPGVAQYDDLATLGKSSTRGVGGEATIEVTTGLIDPSRRDSIAQKVASLAFELSELQ